METFERRRLGGGKRIVTESSTAELRLSRLLERLLTSAEASMAAGDGETARATAEEVLAVDPGNDRAQMVLARLAEPPRRSLGERALLTLMFSDLVGSTMLSERVEPEQLRDLFALYRSTAREAVERYGGHILQYLGDGILALFGFPDAHEDDARRAVLAGLDLVGAMTSIRRDIEGSVGVVPQVRVGLHTGLVLVAAIRDDRSVPERDSIVGNAPNLAARIQGTAQPDQVVISDVTEHLVASDFFLRSLGEQNLKGISRPVEVFAVDRLREAGDRLDAQRYRGVRLIGRDEQRDALLAAWEAVRAGTVASTSTFLVVGEAGIGKTRLVADVAATVGVGQHRFLGTACLPYYSNLSLWPLSRMLERVVAGDDSGRATQQLLVGHLASIGMDPDRSVPFLGPLVGVAADSVYPAPELDPSAALDETVTQIVDWIAALGAQRPRLLVVEDLHWADPSTLTVMTRLAQKHPRGVLTIATTRNGSVINWGSEARTLSLGGLCADAADGLVDALTSGEPLAADVRASILGQAEGNPLFIEELTRSVVESRDEPIPMRLQELLTWRLKSPLVDLRVVQAAATVGPVFDADVVSAVIGDRATVTSQMAVLGDAGVIQPVDPKTGVYRFRHALMRDAAYETQVLDVRSQTHARVAEALQVRGGQPGLVAEHLDRAGDAAGAARQYTLAAVAEQSRGAHAEGAKLLTRALELQEEVPESVERDLAELTARMLRAFSVTSLSGYASPDAESDERRAEDLASRLGDRPEVLPSLVAICAYRTTRGDLRAARSLVDRLMAMASEASFSWFEPEAVSTAAWVAMLEGRISEAHSLQRRALALFLARPREESVSPFWPLPHDPIAISEICMACLSAVRGEAEETQRWERRALARAQELDFPVGPWTLAFVKTFAAWIRRFRGEYAESRALGADVVGIGTEHGYEYWILMGSVYVAGTSPEGTDRTALERAVDTVRASGQEFFAPSNIAGLSRLYAHEGDFDQASDRVNRALEVVAKTGERLHLPELLRQRAEYSMALLGPRRDVADDLREAIMVATDQGASVSRLRAAVALARLPGDVRPGDWRGTLSTARAAVPTSLASDDTAAADQLLA